ncbi:MAG: hypothetical protein GOMPHAMPRED_003395 [Gomphillus americanus]|uniref:non-specific serine/threonine protein kinase n=1 Tax=Gomphillus americanus TaxID=1940652 RepID=A0A8H3EN24_9LECA|nr:MAG: hypothetical protein GOMPHAMPRED_003395 [Gomphillus americanus]
MKNISHDHIVALKYTSFEAGPKLYFEYVPEGSLEGHLPTTSLQRVQITIQLLSGLTYLHGKQPPIAHRDIKPENVLVKHWSDDIVHVMLSDFGLSKQSNDLKSFCGTILYAAPEIFYAGLVGRGNGKKYDPLVDNWSLSVLLVSLECYHLPKFSKHYAQSGTAWAKKVVNFALKHLESHGPNELLLFLIEDMLVIDPKGRKPTKECYDRARRLLGGKIQTLATGDGENVCEETDVAISTASPAEIVDSELPQAANCLATNQNDNPKPMARVPSTLRKRRRSSED